MKLRPSSFLILGMVRLGIGSGYAIKKVSDFSTRFFWPTSLAQVYPELRKLEKAGLLSRRDDPRGDRERFAYELTGEGRGALIAWMRSSHEAETQFRDEGILRLFFADVLEREDQIALVGRLRARAREGVRTTREEILPRATELESAGVLFPARVARLREEAYATAERWFSELETELLNSTDGDEEA